MNWFSVKIIALVIAVGVPSGSLYWYYFEDTLMLTEIIKEPENPRATIFLNLMDFDTGLTRYDIRNLASKSRHWEARIKEVEAIRDPQRRAFEQEKLMAEMMQDPSFKKIAKKVFAFGLDSALVIVQALTGI
jgi:hypothetical protein